MGDTTASPRLGTLIIGNCQAGVQLASTLRELGDTDPITLVGEEPHAPYQRPPLSKAFLKGEATADSLAFRSHDFYREHSIDLVPRERIFRIIRTADGGVATAESGRTFAFARLALTTGAVPRTIPFEGSELEGVSYLRTATEATVLEQQLREARNVVVVGGGFIGLEVAAGARAAGKNVTVLEAAPRLVGRAVSEQTSEFYLQAHRRRGIRVVLNAQVVRFVGEHDRVTGVELGAGDADGSGEIVAADVVLIGVGVVPRTELAVQARPRGRKRHRGGRQGPRLRRAHRGRRGLREHAEPVDRGLRRRPHPPRKRAECRRAGQGGRGDPARAPGRAPDGAVVLVGPGRPQTADRRAEWWA
ncbi:NAD(P)/FAD-dependent oxidoreductase [Cryobacterium breve]|uniref:NAD(P)/FAD-dependent oxidoreductase n=1 Tax=Cryobacterium breve TaxID=1259258 RepID=UPI00248A95B2|nr:FAD-dependent oxidoreductase [Cryobacterium breve]